MRFDKRPGGRAPSAVWPCDRHSAQVGGGSFTRINVGVSNAGETFGSKRSFGRGGVHARARGPHEPSLELGRELLWARACVAAGRGVIRFAIMDNELEALLERELAEQREQEATDARQPAGGQRDGGSG